MGALIGFDEIAAALDEMLERFEAVGPPDGSAEPVEVWMREQGIDGDGVRHAAMHAVASVPPDQRTEALASWVEGFTIGWTLAKRSARG